MSRYSTTSTSKRAPWLQPAASRMRGPDRSTPTTTSSKCLRRSRRPSCSMGEAGRNVQSTRIVIVGGGITGLSAAAAAAARALEIDAPVSITLLEASSRLGGNIVTERVDGYVLDAGPDSWVASKPHATALAKSLGLGS